MSIILGKYQLRVTQADDSGHIINSSKLASSRFNQICGFGRTKIRWVLAQVGGNENSRVLAFMRQKYLINREVLVSLSVSTRCSQYLGVELRQLYSKQRSRRHRFLTSFKLARAKVRGPGKSRALNNRAKKKLFLINKNEVGG